MQHGLDSYAFLASSLDLFISEDISLNIFYSDLDMESALELGVIVGGWFACVNPMEEREILDSFLENSLFPTNRSEPRREESTSSLENFSTHGSELSSFTPPYSTVEPSPKPRTLKEEEIRPS